MKRKAVPMLVQSQHLVTAWPAMSTRERSVAAAMHQHYEREFTRLRDTPNQEGLAAGLGQQVDEAMEHLQRMQPAQAAQVPCRRGCAACCHQHVTITKPEALLLLHYAQAEQVPLDWQLVQRQAENASLARWHKQPREDWRCAFLGADDTCMAYEYRPMVCRKHAVIGDAQQCDTEKNPGGRVLNFVSMEAEIVTSAALSALEWGTLPAMLLKHKGAA